MEYARNVPRISMKPSQMTMKVNLVIEITEIFDNAYQEIYWNMRELIGVS